MKHMSDNSVRTFSFYSPHLRQLLDCYYLFIVGKLLFAEYRYVKIFQQLFVAAKSQENERYELLFQATGYLQNITADNMKWGNSKQE